MKHNVDEALKTLVGEWKNFQGMKPSVRLSFILSSPRYHGIVPPDVGIHGLEINYLDVNQHHLDLNSLFAILPRVAQLSIIHVYGNEKLKSKQKEDSEKLLRFFDDVVESTRKDANAGIIGAKEVFQPWRLVRFQYGGKHDADVYLKIAQRLGKAEWNLQELRLSLENVSFPAPHSRMAHGIKRDQHILRKTAWECSGPADVARRDACAASGIRGFYRTFNSFLAPMTVKFQSRRALLGSSLFWKTDSEMLRRLRKEPNKVAKFKVHEHWQEYGPRIRHRLI